MKNTIKNLHQAAQYLAAAGISFLDKKSDDSHTNVGWNKAKNRMETHAFGNQDQLGINLNTAKIEWLKNGFTISELTLNNTSHADVLSWIETQTKKQKIANTYRYDFHYELPYNSIKNEDTYTLDLNELNYISKELTIAQDTFGQFLKTEQLESPIRIWPHHFDLGIYTQLSAENTFMGAGLAIPDSLVDDLYFYASGYKNGEGIETKDFGKMIRT